MTNSNFNTAIKIFVLKYSFSKNSVEYKLVIFIPFSETPNLEQQICLKCSLEKYNAVSGRTLIDFNQWRTDWMSTASTLFRLGLKAPPIFSFSSTTVLVHHAS